VSESIRGRMPWLLAGVVLLGAALRFSTLGVQSFWLDESVTLRLLRFDLVQMLENLSSSESSPPLYYVLAWGWARVFGMGEVASRALPALLGTLTIPVAYAAGRELLDRRAGLVTAALVACNPMLVWYSQETRVYALLALCSALSFLFFVRAWRDARPITLALWALASSAAVCTHYFAGFLFAFEAAVLLVRAVRARSELRPVVVACAVPALTGLALLPLLLRQREGKIDWISERGLLTNVRSIPMHFMTGTEGRLRGAVLAGGLLVLAALVLLALRATPERRRAALLALGAGGTVIAVPIALTVTGNGYVIPRNLLPALVPLLVAVAGGIAAARAGPLGLILGAALCAVWLAVSVAVPVDGDLQRADWRDVAAGLGPAHAGRVVVVSPDYEEVSLRQYVPGLQPVRGVVEGTEVQVVRSEYSSFLCPECHRIGGPLAPPLPGLVPAGGRTVQKMRIDVFRASRPVVVSGDILRPRLGDVAVLRRAG
jgi:mannosyltransferase